MAALLVLAAALSYAAPAAPAPAPAPASARLVYADGPVGVISAGRVRAAKAGDKLFDGDVIKTGPRATAIVELPDGSRVKLRADTSLKLQLSQKGAGLAGVLLSAGGVFARIASGASRHFQVATPHAVASVRGTEFFTAYGRAGKGGRDLWVCVGKGAVEVRADASPGALTVREGEGILLPGGDKTSKPQAYEWTKTLNWNMDPEGGAVSDRTELDAAYSDLRDQDYR